MANNLNLDTTIDSWADIVVKSWRRKITDLDIGYSGALFDSFVFNVLSGTGGAPERVDFSYNYYGTFVDMGVGNGVYIGNPGDVKTTRKAKPWKSKLFFAQAARLSEILAEKYGIIGATVISENININNRKYNSSLSGDAANRRSLASMFQQPTGLSELDRVWMRRNGLLNL